MYRNEWIPALIPEFNFDFLDGNRNTKAYESYERGDLPLRDITGGKGMTKNPGLRPLIN